MKSVNSIEPKSKINQSIYWGVVHSKPVKQIYVFFFSMYIKMLNLKTKQSKQILTKAKRKKERETKRKNQAQQRQKQFEI